MSDYCNCCATNAQFIEQHYLEAFRACFPREECTLTLRDVQKYRDELLAFEGHDDEEAESIRSVIA